MPTIIKKIKPKGATTSIIKKPLRSAPLQLTLPDGPEQLIVGISDATFLIYGENKIGKTSLASRFPDPFFLMFEPGAKDLNVARRQVMSWKEFRRYVQLIKESDKFKTVVIDPVSTAYKYCVQYILDKEGVDDPREVSWGNGWKAIEDEFIAQILAVTSTDRGVVFLGHPETAEFERRSGGKFDMIVPRMMKQARNFIEDFVDVTAFYGYYGNDRYFTIEGSDALDAGNRLTNHFRTISGEKIHSIPMFDPDDSRFDEVRSYENLIAAFNNEQEDRCEPEKYDPSLTTRARRTEKKEKTRGRR